MVSELLNQQRVPRGARLVAQVSCHPSLAPEFRDLQRSRVAYRLNDKLLIVGAGTSQLAEDMLAAGYRSIHCMDVSQVCISQLTEVRHAAYRFGLIHPGSHRTSAPTPTQRYDRLGLSISSSVQDVASMDFPEESFGAPVAESLTALLTICLTMI